MRFIFPLKLKVLADKIKSPLYIVGGYVRNFLIDGTVSKDIDLTSPAFTEEIVSAVLECGFKILAEYKRTKTVLFTDGENQYEFTSFREEKYHRGGEHTPYKVIATTNITKDAKRRDFKCNAVYYDIKKDEITDPLGGVRDIRNKVLDTVVAPDKVFSHDGLRLMRLARFSGELNFIPTDKVLRACKKNAKNILDISPERIFEELKKILVADCKYGFSNKDGHYTGLKILADTGVLDCIMPELTLGRNMAQRKDYHKHDVLEHSLRSVLYGDKDVRLFALLHDVGKPFAMLKNGKFSNHAEYGKEIAEKILLRLKADKKTVEKAKFLVLYHMLDVKNGMTDKEVRRFLVDNVEYFFDLKRLKQADFTAGKDCKEICPTVIKWERIYKDAKENEVPFCIKDLKITAKDLVNIGYKGESIKKELSKLFYLAVEDPSLNKLDFLLTVAKKDQTENLNCD